MDNIIDITFNFELYEDVLLNSVKNFNNAVDRVAELKDVKQELDNQSGLLRHSQTIKNLLGKSLSGEDEVKTKEFFRKCLNASAVNAISDLRVKTKIMKNSFDTLINLMKARVYYIESNHTQDEIYGNYKLRTEKQGLNRKIKKYEQILESNLKIAEGYSLKEFGLEIDGEPDMK